MLNEGDGPFTAINSLSGDREFLPLHKQVVRPLVGMPITFIVSDHLRQRRVEGVVMTVGAVSLDVIDRDKVAHSIDIDSVWTMPDEFAIPCCMSWFHQLRYGELVGTNEPLEFCSPYVMLNAFDDRDQVVHALNVESGPDVGRNLFKLALQASRARRTGEGSWTWSLG